MSGIDHSDIHSYKRREMSSRVRGLFGPIPCLLGVHNWGPPKAQNSLIFCGERQDDGTWEHWTEDPSKIVTQYCQSCSKYRERNDLDWEILSEIQRGNNPSINTDTE